MQYADDHDGDLPRRGQGVQPTKRFDRPNDWFNALPPYLESKSLMVLTQFDKSGRAEKGIIDGAPKAGSQETVQDDKNVHLDGVWTCPTLMPDDEPKYFSYGMNMWLSASKGVRPDNVKSLSPLSTIRADGPGGHCSILPANKPYSPDPRHAGSVNIAFLDGHVAAFTGADAGCGVGIPQRDDLRWIAPNSAWSGPEDL
jgi:prepilin-type processing-associated H-X9-DG protein